MEMEWSFKVGGHWHTKKLDLINLTEIKNYLNLTKKNSNFIELDHTLVNIDSIEMVCETKLLANGTVQI